MITVSVNNIVKSYGAKKEKVTAVDGISFDVGAGELFGVIGPDGAGKTSLFRMMATLLLPDSGTATVDGFDTVKSYKEIRRRIGYMPGRFSLYPDLTVLENINFFATVFNTTLQQNYELVKDIYSQIEPFANRRAGKLSGGMKQKLALSCALIHRPTVLLLDEPTTGVDAVSRKEFWDMLKKLKQQGITIIVSTPYMDEAGLCDRIALLQNGRVLSLNTPAGVTAGFSHVLLKVKAPDMLRVLQLLRSSDAVMDAYPFGEFHHVVLRDNEVPAPLKDRLLADQPQTTIEPTEPDIEDCFIGLMKN